jgi:predicted metalloprotease
MRLDDINESDQVEDRRGGGGGGMRMGGGSLGIGTVVILGVIGWALGINPAVLIGGAEMVQGMRNGGQQVSTAPSGPVSDNTGKFVARVLGSTETVWSQVLPQQANVRYTKPQLVLFSGSTRSSCGAAQAAMGPFYCPLDRKVYLDTAFFQEMQKRLGGGGDFAYAYVIAHEVGHHVQNLLGILPKVQEAQQRLPRREANALSVRVELMADCLAGVWANHSKDQIHLDQNDIREAMTTASAIGDDALQKQSQGYAVPDSFTHGSSAQRQQWFTTGFQSGSVKTCNTFQSRQ